MDTQTQETNTDRPVEHRAAVNGEIRSLARVAGLPQNWVDSQIDAGATVAEAQTAAFAAMRVRSEATAAVRTATACVDGHDANDPEWRVRTIGEAVLTAACPAPRPAMPQGRMRGSPWWSWPKIACARAGCRRSAIPQLSWSGP